MRHFSLLQDHFLIQENFFHDFLRYKCVFKMKLNNFIVGSYLIGIGLVIGFQLQSAITHF